MAIVANKFTCTNGHDFTANAKLRARCPTCGEMTKRSFTVPEPVPAPEVKPPKPSRIKRPRLIKQGNPNRPPRVRVRKPKSLADTIREAKDNATVAGRKTVRRKPGTPVTPISGGLVVKKRVAKGVTPAVKRRPKKSSVSKVVEAHGGGNEAYWNKVAARFMPRFGRRG